MTAGAAEELPKGVMARRKSAKKRSVHAVHEHSERFSNAASAALGGSSEVPAHSRCAMRYCVVALCWLLYGCGSHAYHLVQRGDSLYSISWSYGYDYKDVARWNKLQSPYVLTVGQQIRFIPPRGYVAVAPVKSATRDATVSVPVQMPRVIAPDKPVSNPRNPNHLANLVWQWPTEGSVLHRFDASDALKKGIDISGELGQPVRAAAAGKVVYSGSGLIGYGKLIILKHNETLLSAYAHNKDLLVSEGEVVDAGKRIAVMGSSGANVVMLHFEIRRDGVPVDPLEYLPGR